MIRSQLTRDVVFFCKKKIPLSTQDEKDIVNKIHNLSDKFISENNNTDLAMTISDIIIGSISKQRGIENAHEGINNTKQRELLNTNPTQGYRSIRDTQQGYKPPNVKPQQYAEPNNLDIHEILKTEIGNMPETINHELPYATNDNADLTNNIKTIFGSCQPQVMQNIFNPSALEKKSYMVLDRKYQAQNTNNTNTFVWHIATNSSSSTEDNSAGSTAPLRDIVSITMKPFVFPATFNALTQANRISVTILELNQQAVSAVESACRYHFLFKVANTSVTTSLVQGFDLEDINTEPATFEFYKPIEELRSITLQFGNPFQTLPLLPDSSVSTTAVASPAVTPIFPGLFCTQVVIGLPVGFNAYSLVNDAVFITGFTTTDPVADATLIELMNDPYGWNITSLSVTNSITIQIYKYIGTIPTSFVGMAVPGASIYFDARRFIIPIEFTFKQYST